MVKVISFSLWGSLDRYTLGAVKNAKLAKKFYPDFECWFYIHRESVPSEIVSELLKLDNAKVILKEGDLNTCRPMMWRFETIDDENVEVNMSRDLDSRVCFREKVAVDEWLKSKKLFHIMRDHPHHACRIMRGMFGTRKIPSVTSWCELINKVEQQGDKNYDKEFLWNNIYPQIEDSVVIHATFGKLEGDKCKEFPVVYEEDYKFIGEYIFEDDSRSQPHINDLKDHYKGEVKNVKLLHMISSFFSYKNTKYPKDSENERFNEIKWTLLKNLDCVFIEKIHLFVDDNEDLEVLRQITSDNVNKDKIIIAKIGKQPKYCDFFDYIINNIDDKICMITNSDIYLKDLEYRLINELDKNNCVYAITRHEPEMWERGEIVGYWGSHDSYIFKSSSINESILHDSHTHFTQNYHGIESRIVSAFVNLGLKVLNPYTQIICIHVHKSGVTILGQGWVGLHRCGSEEEFINSVWNCPLVYL